MLGITCSIVQSLKMASSSAARMFFFFSILLASTNSIGSSHRYTFEANDIVTFMLEGELTVEVTYPTLDGTNTAHLTVPGSRQGVLITQDPFIDIINGTLTRIETNISWSDQNFTLQFINAADYGTNQWWISEVEFAYNATPPITNSTLPKTALSQTYSSLYRTAMKELYHCLMVHFDLVGTTPQSYARVNVKGFKMQAFQFDNKTFSDKTNDCVEPFKTTEIVLPVVIGGVLLVLALVSLTIYALGCWCFRKRRSQRYQTIS